MISSRGWRTLSEYVEKQIKALQGDLERREFENLAQVALLQGRLQAFRAVLDYPETRLEEHRKKQLKEAK